MGPTLTDACAHYKVGVIGVAVRVARMPSADTHHSAAHVR